MKAEENNTNTILPPQQEFEDAIVSSLDIDSWVLGQDLGKIYEQINVHIKEGLENENRAIEIIRNEIIPEIGSKHSHLPYVGLDQFNAEFIEKAHRGLLFNGGVEACDGTRVTHDTLPITITQIGVCLVSYMGTQGAYAHRLFRKDLQIAGEDPLKEVINLLEIRRDRGSQGIEESSGGLSTLAQRGLMAYAERGILMDKSNAIWRVGHGSPFPYELLTGYWASRKELADAALDLFRKIVGHQKIIFIPSAPKKREILTLGNALKPMEYLIIGSIENDIKHIIETGGTREPMRSNQLKFAEKYGSQIVYGLYKASPFAPAYLFYAHKDHAPTAALIAMADSVLQEHRGFPMLIDIADTVCKSTFSPESFFATIRQSYAEAGYPFKYLSERETRSF